MSNDTSAARWNSIAEVGAIGAWLKNCMVFLRIFLCACDDIVKQFRINQNGAYKLRTEILLVFGNVAVFACLIKVELT